MTELYNLQEQLKTLRRVRDQMQTTLDRDEADYLAAVKVLKQLGIDETNIEKAAEKIERAIKQAEEAAASYVEKLDALLR